MVRVTSYSEEEVRKMLPKPLRPWCEANGVHYPHAVEFKNAKRGPCYDLLGSLGLEYRIVRRPRP